MVPLRDELRPFRDSLQVANIQFHDNSDRCSPSGRRAHLIADIRAGAAGSGSTAPTRLELVADSRLRDYQTDIERASALLCKVQPDLVAGENVPIKDLELGRSRWPFVFTICASGLFWIGIGWAFAAII